MKKRLFSPGSDYCEVPNPPKRTRNVTSTAHTARHGNNISDDNIALVHSSSDDMKRSRTRVTHTHTHTHTAKHDTVICVLSQFVSSQKITHIVLLNRTPMDTQPVEVGSHFKEKRRALHRGHESEHQGRTQGEKGIYPTPSKNAKIELNN